MLKRKQKSPTFDAPDLVALAERSVRLDNGEILDALDVTLSSLCKYVPEYRRTKEKDFLGEIDLAAQAIYVMAKELSIRAGEVPSTKPTRQSRHY